MKGLVLIAVGGNALIRAGQKGTAQEQFENAVDTAAVVVALIGAGYRVVLTHGNGPQVGAALVRSELAAAHAYRLPLDCCVASTQGEIGYVLQYALWQALQAQGLETPVVSLVTQVLVDRKIRRLHDPPSRSVRFIHGTRRTGTGTCSTGTSWRTPPGVSAASSPPPSRGGSWNWRRSVPASTGDSW